MTMTKSTDRIAAGEFKAKCLALLDEVSDSGRTIVVTKRGRPVARIVPVEEAPSLAGSGLHEGDLISPIGDDWGSDR